MAVINTLQKPQMVYIQKETTNQSFLNMHYYLKNKGIQNNDFFLCLIDPSVAGLDPYDPNLTSIQKAKIFQECTRNYWYFLREVVRLPQQGSSGHGVRYELHRENLAMNFLYVLNFNMFVEAPRQVGKTTAALIRYLWVYNFGTTNSEIVFLHKDHTGSKANLKNLRAIRDNLPSYLQMSSAVGTDGKRLKVPNTVVMIQHPFNNNRITTLPSARNKDAAGNLARGMTVPVIYMDEIAFLPYNKEIYMAAAPAFSRASENAKANNAPYGVVLTTTPGDLLTDSGMFAYNMRNNATKFDESFYDRTYQELCAIRDSNSNSNFFLLSFSYQQLGRGQEYFKQMVIQMNKSWPDIRREVLLEWAETSDDCPFSHDDLEIIKMHTKEAKRVIYFGRFKQYPFNIYEDIDLQYPPIIGVDVSGAMFHDSSAITVIDSHTTRVCAALNCNYMPTDDLAQVIYDLVTQYMPNAICNIERNGGFGVSVIQRLCKTTVKNNLYWEVKDKVIEESFNGVHMEKRPRRVKVYGLDSTEKVRARLIEILYERVALHKDKFVCPIIFDEMRSMIVSKKGRVDHSDHSHDDQTFSYLMALYVWYDGKNLAQNFHIYKNTLKTDEEEELDEAPMEESLEAKEKLDIDKLTYDPDEDDNPDKQEILADLNWIENDKFITAKQLRDQVYLKDKAIRDKLFERDKLARESYANQSGIDPSMYGNGVSENTVRLPESIFGAADDDIDYNDDYFNDDGDYAPRNSVLQGNLSDLYSSIDDYV